MTSEVGFARVTQIKGTVVECNGLSPNLKRFYPGLCYPPASPGTVVNLGFGQSNGQLSDLAHAFIMVAHHSLRCVSATMSVELRNSFGPFGVDDAFQAVS